MTFDIRHSIFDIHFSVFSNHILDFDVQNLTLDIPFFQTKSLTSNVFTYLVCGGGDAGSNEQKSESESSSDWKTIPRRGVGTLMCSYRPFVDVIRTPLLLLLLPGRGEGLLLSDEKEDDGRSEGGGEGWRVGG